VEKAVHKQLQRVFIFAGRSAKKPCQGVRCSPAEAGLIIGLNIEICNCFYCGHCQTNHDKR